MVMTLYPIKSPSPTRVRSACSCSLVKVKQVVDSYLMHARRRVEDGAAPTPRSCVYAKIDVATDFKGRYSFPETSAFDGASCGHLRLFFKMPL